MPSLFTKLKDFWSKNEVKIVIFFGLILVATISFEFGLIQGKKGQSSPLIIEQVAQAQTQDSQSCSIPAPGAQNLTSETKKTLPAISTQVKNCAFVGSKNSNKFYPPTCSYAKRIKPENIVCFATAQEAIAQGRTASTGCK
jgi:hypothetical protein